MFIIIVSARNKEDQMWVRSVKKTKNSDVIHTYVYTVVSICRAHALSVEERPRAPYFCPSRRNFTTCTGGFVVLLLQ